jgi:AcrR family transcriptional regulator
MAVAERHPPPRPAVERQPIKFVVGTQRERILAAVAQVSSEVGYPDMTVGQIVRRAGVSRRTFYGLFKNKHDAFLAACEEAFGRVVGRVAIAVSEQRTFAGQAAAGLRVLLEFAANEPAFARMCLVEALAAGPEATGQRTKVLVAFASLVDSQAQATLDDPPGPLTAELVIGGIHQVIYTRVLKGETERLPELGPELLYLSLLPYLGHEAAATERLNLLDSSALAVPA